MFMVPRQLEEYKHILLLVLYYIDTNKTLTIVCAIHIDAKFPNQTTGTADKFAFRERENR